MTEAAYNRLVIKNREHKVFNSDWEIYYSIDFADTLLPEIPLYRGRGLWTFDGAELFDGLQKTARRVLDIDGSGTLINLIAYTYPKDVKASVRKQFVQAGESEVCIFAEVAQDDSIELSFTLGKRFKDYLKNLAAEGIEAPSPADVESQTYPTTIADFKAVFGNHLVHEDLMRFVLETIGVNIQEKENIEIKIQSIKLQTSERVGYIKKEGNDETERKIIFNFEVLHSSFEGFTFSVYKNRDKIYEENHLQPIIISSNPESKPIEDDESYYEPGVYQIIWDCSQEDVFETERNQKLTFLLQIKSSKENEYKATKSLSIRELVENAEINNYLYIIAPEKQEKDKDSYIKIYGDEIINRQKQFLSKIPKKVYDKLSKKGKLILNLPVILTKLNFLHGALCQIHWLEGTGESIQFPYEFFISEKRVENIDKKNLEAYFNHVQYLSVENLGYTPSNPDGLNLFLFNESIPSVKRSLDLFNYNLSNRTNNGEIGDYENLATRLDEEVVTKENYFQSFSIGSAFGDIDDIGTALGRYSQRCYFVGVLWKNESLDRWILSIEQVGSRFFDDFSFNDRYLFGLRSQDLGYWDNNIEKPSLPRKHPFRGGILLQNSDFLDLKKILNPEPNKGKKLIITDNACRDFAVYSEIKRIADEFIKKDILIL